jgi:hypothetical protein
VGQRLHVVPASPGQVQWQVWYRDTFDRECPPRVEVAGLGLKEGLVELWARHLFETVRPDGSTGFSRFTLSLFPGGIVHLAVDAPGLARLRAWIFGRREHTRRGYVAAAADRRLLERLAAAHAALLPGDPSAAGILSAAAAASDRRDFESRLDDPASFRPATPT